MNELEVHGEDMGGQDGSGDAGNRGTNRNLLYVALGLGAFGLIVGITGIVSANGAAKEVAALRKEFAARPDPALTLKAAIKEMDDRIVKVGEETMRTNTNLRQMRDQVQRALDTMAAEVRANRERIDKNSTALSSGTPAPAKEPSTLSEKANALLSGTGSGGPAAAAPAGTPTASNTSATGPKVHTVQPGDSFWKMSKQYGVTIEAIEAANPGVSSSKLQVGQSVNIP